MSIMWHHFSDVQKEELASHYVTVLQAHIDAKDTNSTITFLRSLSAVISQGMAALLLRAGVLPPLCRMHNTRKEPGIVPLVLKIMEDLVDTKCDFRFMDSAYVCHTLANALQMPGFKYVAKAAAEMIRRTKAEDKAQRIAEQLIKAEEFKKAKIAKAAEKRVQSEKVQEQEHAKARVEAEQRKKELLVAKEEEMRKKALEKLELCRVNRPSITITLRPPIKRTKAELPKKPYTADDHQAFITESIMYSLGL